MIRAQTGAGLPTLGVLVVLAVILGLLWKRERKSSAPSETAAVADSKSLTTLAKLNASGPPLTQAEQLQAGSPLVADLLRPEGTAQQDLEIIRELISQYFTALQNRPGPPIGDNADLVRALTGKNPLKLAVILPGHAVVSGDGLLRDRWGTPYHLHRLSERRFEIRSAGPDLKLFTADDVLSP